MYLFSRRARLAGGNTRKAMAWATEITEQVNQLTGINVALYSQVFSPEVGTLVWASFVPDLATLESAGDKMAVDDKLTTLADKGAQFTIGGLDDHLAQVLSGAPDRSRTVEYVTAVQAVCASGSVVRGAALGVEIAERAEQITGTPTLFMLNSSGPYGGVTWTTGFTDVHAMEVSQAALAADTAWGEYVDRETAGVYAEEPALTMQLIYRRIA